MKKVVNIFIISIILLTTACSSNKNFMLNGTIWETDNSTVRVFDDGIFTSTTKFPDTGSIMNLSGSYEEYYGQEAFSYLLESKSVTENTLNSIIKLKDVYTIENMIAYNAILTSTKINDIEEDLNISKIVEFGFLLEDNTLIHMFPIDFNYLYYDNELLITEYYLVK